MRAPVSVVIPTLNAADGIGPCLAALAEGLPMIRELILADGGSTDGIAQVAEDVGARLVTAAPGRGGQLRAGIAVATGDWLLIVHADTVLAEGWPAAAQAHLLGSDAGWFRLRFDAAGFWPWWVARWANWRSRWVGLPYGDQGLLIRRDVYEAAGGYPDIPLMEDVALARRLRGRLVEIPAIATTSAARFQRDGWLRRGWRNLTTLALYLLGHDPSRLVERYRR